MKKYQNLVILEKVEKSLNKVAVAEKSGCIEKK